MIARQINAIARQGRCGKNMDTQFMNPNRGWLDKRKLGVENSENTLMKPRDAPKAFLEQLKHQNRTAGTVSAATAAGAH